MSDRVEPLPVATARVVRELVREGAPNALLAKQLRTSEQTVKWHLARAMRMSGTQSRTALTLWWIRSGQYALSTSDEDDDLYSVG